jgi:protein gp37
VDYEYDDRWTRAGTSPECFHCYAETLSNKRGWTSEPWLERYQAENVQLHPERFRGLAKLPVRPITLPPSQRERIFICSMGDIFHPLVPDDFFAELWEWMRRYPHIYMLLTKRPERAAKWKGPWPDHIWLGTTCGHPVTRWRLNALRDSGAAVRFVSAEPLLDSLAMLDLTGIRMVIVGGESGANRRKMDMRWARELRNKCVSGRVAYFFKQGSNYFPDRDPYLVEEDGRCMQYRQFPGELMPPVSMMPKAEMFPIVV